MFIMKSLSELVDKITKLIDAENLGQSDVAETVLSKNFVAITRANGEEQNREDLLSRIDHPTKKNIVRRLEGGIDIMPLSRNFALIGSVVTTIDKTNPSIILGRFQNIHIFIREDEWRCIVWEVVEQK
jgi:hypothetical protein